MEENKLQRDAFALAKQQGWDPARLTPVQNAWIAASLRSTTKLLADGAKAVTSIAATSLRLRVVSDEKAAGNEATCRTNKCGQFGLLVNSKPVCMECQCTGRGLQSKWKDSVQFCPKIDPATGKPYWSNIGVSATVETVEHVPDGDMNATGVGPSK